MGEGYNRLDDEVEDENDKLVDDDEDDELVDDNDEDDVERMDEVILNDGVEVLMIVEAEVDAGGVSEVEVDADEVSEPDVEVDEESERDEESDAEEMLEKVEESVPEVEDELVVAEDVDETLPELGVPVIGSKQLHAEVIRAGSAWQLSNHVGVGIAEVV